MDKSLASNLFGVCKIEDPANLASRSPAGAKTGMNPPTVAGSGDSCAKRPACHQSNRSKRKLRLLARIILFLEVVPVPLPSLSPRCRPPPRPVCAHRRRVPRPCEPGTSVAGLKPPRTATAGDPSLAPLRPPAGRGVHPEPLRHLAGDLVVRPPSPSRRPAGPTGSTAGQTLASNHANSPSVRQAAPNPERSSQSAGLRELSGPSTREQQARIAKLEGLHSAEGPHGELADVVA